MREPWAAAPFRWPAHTRPPATTPPNSRLVYRIRPSNSELRIPNFEFRTSNFSLQRVSVAIFARQQIVGVWRRRAVRTRVARRSVRDAHLVRVVVELLARAKRHDTKQHDLGEVRRV